MRLDKMLSDCNIASRSEIKKIMKEGRITCNGVVVSKPELQINEYQDEILLDQKKVIYQKYIFLMLNKPPGVISATQDNKDKTVIDLLPAEYQNRGLFPVGRLDKDTTGLLILTNDGQFAHNALAPKKKVAKTYIAAVNGPLTQHDVEAFQSGIEIDGGYFTKPAQLHIIHTSQQDALAKVVIHEGKFHQIKRMFAKRGLCVTSLKRVKMGELDLPKDLAEGSFIKLTPTQIASIF